MRIIFTYIALLAFLGQSYAAERINKSKESAKPPTRIVKPINKLISVASRARNNQTSIANPYSTEGLIAGQEKEISKLKEENRNLLKDRSFILNELKNQGNPFKEQYTVYTTKSSTKAEPATAEEKRLETIKRNIKRNNKKIKNAEDTIIELKSESDSE